MFSSAAAAANVLKSFPVVPIGHRARLHAPELSQFGNIVV
jgi:hypothetical protein